MRTRLSWLGLTKRWTPSASQRDFEDPTTVLIVGRDEADDNALWLGEAFSGPADPVIGFSPFTDVFVLGAGMVSAGGFPPNVDLNGGIEPKPPVAATPALSPAFIRPPSIGPPNAEFVRRVAPAASGPVIVEFNSRPQENLYDPPGILVRSTEILWFSAGAVVGQNIVLRVMWRGTQ